MKDVNSKHHVYLLKDPFTFEIFYIGFTSFSPQERMRRHKHQPHNPCLKRKLAQTSLDGSKPIYEVVNDNMTRQAAINLETSMIKRFKPYCNISKNPDKKEVNHG